MSTFAKYGILVYDENGNRVSWRRIYKQVVGVWPLLTDREKRELAIELVGKENAVKFMVYMENLVFIVGTK